MAKKVDFTESLKQEIDPIISEEEKEDTLNINGFVIKKPDAKKQKVNFVVYTEKEKLNNLDKIAKKNGVSRNELINQFIDYILENNQKSYIKF